MFGVAALAIFQAAVINDEGGPLGGVVAIGTIAIRVGGRCFMTDSAVGVTDMVEHNRFPIIGNVASGALKMIVRRRIFFSVAGNTVLVALMIKCGFRPILRVCVAVDTWPRFASKAGGSLDQIAVGANHLISSVK